jgi:hypothetical protein
MKYALFFVLFLFNPLLNAQWVQTNLGDAQIGYSLYSTNTELFAATLNGIYSTTNEGDNWF